jgi:hypothetical protein
MRHDSNRDVRGRGWKRGNSIDQIGKAHVPVFTTAPPHSLIVTRTSPFSCAIGKHLAAAHDPCSLRIPVPSRCLASTLPLLPRSVLAVAPQAPEPALTTTTISLPWRNSHLWSRICRKWGWMILIDTGVPVRPPSNLHLKASRRVRHLHMRAT